MAKQWKCARCSTKNDEGTLTCSNCRMIRGAVVVPGSFSSSQDPAAAPPASYPGWPTADETEARRLAAEPNASYWTAGVEPTGEPVSKPLWRRLPIGGLIIVVLLAAGAIGGAISDASRSSTGEITREGDMMATDLRVGDCFDLKDPTAEEISDVTARPCGVAHEYELIYTGSMPEGSYPTDAAFDAFFEDQCVPAFGAYIGRDYAESRLSIYWLYPVEDAWSAGDRSIQCAAHNPRVNRLSGSLRGSNL